MKKEINKLIEFLKIEKLPAKEREEILEKAEKRLNQVLINVIVENISDEDAIKIKKAMDGSDLRNIEEITAEITSKVPGLANKIEIAITEEMARFRTALNG